MSAASLDGFAELRVRRIAWECEAVNSCELVRPDGGDLVPFTAGAHIDLHLANGLIRSYSLTNDQRERHRYVIAVSRDAASRGGSAFIHERLRVGDVINVSLPRNNFALQEDAAHSVLIAGGIGITPILSMIRRLDGLSRSWALFYAARTRRAAAFLGELEKLQSDGQTNLHLDFDDARCGRAFDLPGIVGRAPADAHLYCCGPLSMLAAFERATAGRPCGHVHVEYFQPREEAATGGRFEVRLVRSNRIIAIQPGKTILDALLDAGVAVNYSCAEGMCGTCETRVLEGVPDHRDQFLSKDEQAANRTIMICCSGAKSRTLVLDL